MSVSDREFAATWGKLIARAWADPEFERRLLSRPAEVLAEYGVRLPEGTRCKVVFDGDEIEEDSTVFYLPFPSRPVDEELSEADLAELAGGTIRAPAVALGPECAERSILTGSYLITRIRALNPMGAGFFKAEGV